MKDYVRLRLASWVEGYSARAVSTLELGQGEPAELPHLPTFFPDRLGPVTELTRATLHIEIDDLDGKAERHSSFPVWLLSRTSAYNGVKDPATGAWKDLTPYYGAWVTPNASAVMQVLRLAADYHPQHRFVGYQVDVEGVAATTPPAFFPAWQGRGGVWMIWWTSADLWWTWHLFRSTKVNVWPRRLYIHLVDLVDLVHPNGIGARPLPRAAGRTNPNPLRKRVQAPAASASATARSATSYKPTATSKSAPVGTTRAPWGPRSSLGALHRGGVAPPERMASHAPRGGLLPLSIEMVRDANSFPIATLRYL
jgi:hypothetical protein